MRQLELPFSHLYNLSVEQYVEFGISEKRSQFIVNGLADKGLLEDALRDVERGNAGFVTIVDESYPDLLRNIIGAPAVLFYQGDISILHKKDDRLCGSA